MEVARCPVQAALGYSHARKKGRRDGLAPSLVVQEPRGFPDLSLRLANRSPRTLQRTTLERSWEVQSFRNGFSNDRLDEGREDDSREGSSAEPDIRTQDSRREEAGPRENSRDKNWNEDVPREQAGNGLSPGLSSLVSRPWPQGASVEAPLRSGASGSAASVSGIAAGEDKGKPSTGSLQNGATNNREPRESDIVSPLPEILGGSVPRSKARTPGKEGGKGPLSSPVFSDLSDGEEYVGRGPGNGSWAKPTMRMGSNGGPGPGSGPGPGPGPGPGWNPGKAGMGGGLPKGVNIGSRGRQSVLGSAVMQGSRFEPGHGDTSWINSMSPDWFPVIPLWQATDKAAVASEQFITHMSQGWRVLLLSDGSVTRHLHLLTGHRVSVECLEMRAIGHSLLGVPPGTALVAGPRVQRQALLKTTDGTPLVYAASWWAEYEAKQHLQEAHTPIWAALQEQRMELFRSLECIYYGHTRELEKLFGRSGPFWARHYLFYHNGRPLTLIYEVFSPALDEWLGDSALPEDLYLP